MKAGGDHPLPHLPTNSVIQCSHHNWVWWKCTGEAELSNQRGIWIPTLSIDRNVAVLSSTLFHIDI